MGCSSRANNMILQLITLFLRGKVEKKPIKIKDFQSYILL